MPNSAKIPVEDRVADFTKLLERLEKVRQIERIPMINKNIDSVHNLLIYSTSEEVSLLFTEENNNQSCRIFKQLLDRRLADASASQSEFLQTYTRFTSTFRDIARSYNAKIGEALANSGIFERLLRELRKETMKKARFAEKIDYENFGSEEYLLRDYLVILTNMINIDRQRKSDTIAQIFVRENGFEVMLPYLEASAYIQVSSMFILAMMVTDDTKETLDKLATHENLHTAVVKLREGLRGKFDSKKKRHSPEGFNVALLLERCNDLMHCSKSCAKIFVKFGLFELLNSIIVARDIDDRSAEESDEKNPNFREPWFFATQQELIGALKCCLTLCFSPSGLKKVKDAENTVAVVKHYAENHENSEIKLLCANIVLQIEGDSMVARSGARKSSADDQQDKPLQVMISYNWAHQKLALRIRDALRQHNIAVWIDVDCMRGNVVEMMAVGVESSDILVMLFSRGYHQSSPCQSEANFAYKLKKRIIPVKVESYEPTGWLGLLIAGLLYYDMSEESAVDSAIERIIEEILNHRNREPESEVPNLDGVDSPKKASHSRILSGNSSQQAAATSTSTSNSNSNSTYSQLEEWSPKKVAEWIHKLNSPALNDKFKEYDGNQLCSLLKIRRESLQLFLSFVEKYNLPNGDVLRLINALDRL